MRDVCSDYNNTSQGAHLFEKYKTTIQQCSASRLQASSEPEYVANSAQGAQEALLGVGATSLAVGSLGRFML